LQCANFRDELEALAAAATGAPGSERVPGIVALHHAFTDHNYAYLITDFYSGGDMLSLVSKLDQFPEEMARFYLAELLLAINEVHRLGFVHRYASAVRH
jgi:serine/threonine protein kinase